MDQILIDKLSEYCDQFIGCKTTPKAHKAEKKQKRKKDEEHLKKDLDDSLTKDVKIYKKLKKEESGESENNELQPKTNSNSTIDKNDTESSNKTVNELKRISELESGKTTKVTDDGFKIVSCVPDDDSDVSDAFDSDMEGEDWSSNRNTLTHTNKSKVKMTEDGFKITSDIPSDDSDVSDAFCDGEESDGTGGDTIAETPSLHSKTIKKPMLKLMKDFGLCEDDIPQLYPSKICTKTAPKGNTSNQVYCVKNSKKKKKKKSKGPFNTETLASKLNASVDVEVIDFSEREKSKKKGKEELVGRGSQLNDKEKLEKEMKAARYEIYKLGVSGFEKTKKQESRINLAIKLGARPPKRKYESYKVLVAKIKAEKKEIKERHEYNRKMGIKEDKKKPARDPKDQKRKPKVFTAQVGRFKDGVQHLSKKDIDRINNS